MTHNNSDIHGAPGFQPEPLHYETFATERTWDPIPALVFDRWWSLSDEERAQRFEIAFDLLFDEVADLDRDSAKFAALASADPEMWWAATVLGRRTLGALERLDAAIETYRQAGALEVAWLVLESASGFFGVAVWLQKQQPVSAEPPTRWVRDLIARCGTDAATLVSEFTFAADRMVLGHCVDAAMAAAWSLGFETSAVFTLQLFVAGEPIPDHAVALDVVAAVSQRVDAELPEALAAADYGRAGQLITIGTGALELACRLGHGYGFADGEWEPF